MNWRTLAAIGIALQLVAALPAAAQKKTTIKMATLAPEGSPWHKALMDMGNEWKEGTEGRVQLRIYPGGIAGDDPDMVRKMRINQLHAGALTVNGLGSIDSALNVFSVPLFFDSFEEYAYVLDKMTPVMKQRLEDKGFVMLFWIQGGWIHLFSRNAVTTIDELKQVKMFTSAGDDSMVQAWKELGFRPVPLAATDILTGLQTGMIDALPATPLAALSMQWFTKAPNMFGEGIAPLLGGTVVSKRTWEKISEADRNVMLAAARKAEAWLTVEIPRKDREAVGEMRERGLAVTELPPGPRQAEIRETARKMAAKMRSSMPAEIFDEAMRHRDRFRREQASGSAP